MKFEVPWLGTNSVLPIENGQNQNFANVPFVGSGQDGSAILRTHSGSNAKRIVAGSEVLMPQIARELSTYGTSDRSKYNALGTVMSCADSIGQKEEKMGNKERYVIVRTYAMGVFAGILDDASTETLKILRCARRIWYWDGAASLSQLATEGTSKPKTCKFPCEVARVELTSQHGFEILDVTDKARESISSVPVWAE